MLSGENRVSILLMKLIWQLKGWRYQCGRDYRWKEVAKAVGTVLNLPKVSNIGNDSFGVTQRDDIKRRQLKNWNGD